MSLPHPKLERDTEGFILAGGQSSRMGQDKALIHLRGTPLIQHAIRILSAAGLNPRIAGARADLSAFAPVIPDDQQQPGHGPLSGICAALSATSAHYAVFLPVDLPLIPADLIAYLLRHTAITKPAITVVSVGGFIQTFPAVIDRVVAPALQTSLHSKDRKCLTAFEAAANALGKPFSVLPIELLLEGGQISNPKGLPASMWFHNINTPQDLDQAESLI